MSETQKDNAPMQSFDKTDLLTWAGVAQVAAGVYLVFGAGWALIVTGMLALVFGLLLARAEVAVQEQPPQ